MREALWALDAIEREWLGVDRSSRLRETAAARHGGDPEILEQILSRPTGRQLALDQQYSLSDRIRYYWPVPRWKRRCIACCESGREPAAAHPIEPIFAAAVRSGPRRAGSVRAPASWCCMPFEQRAAAVFCRLHRLLRADMTTYLQLDEAALTRVGRPVDGARDRAAAGELAADPGTDPATCRADCGFLTPLAGAPDLRIILTGAGSSAFIGECLAPLLLHQLGRRVEAIATTDLLSGPHAVFPARRAHAPGVVRPLRQQPRKRRGGGSGGAAAARMPSAGIHLQRTGNALPTLPRAAATASPFCCRRKRTTRALQ